MGWRGTGPAYNRKAGDCGTLIVNKRYKGLVTNRKAQCYDRKSYCCDPIPTSPTTESPRTKSPTTESPTTKSPTTRSPTTRSPTTKSPTTESATTTSFTECGRIRKEWNTLDQSERKLYIDAMLELSNQGKLQKFTEQHGEASAEAQAHGTSAFLSWHRLRIDLF